MIVIDRRTFSKWFSAGAAAASLTTVGAASASAAPAAGRSATAPAAVRKHPTFGTIKQVKTGALSIGYAELGPAHGPVVILLHGFPYDICSYEQVAPLLAESGYRVLVPYLRGHGATTFLSRRTFRNAQQSVFALDLIGFMDALRIPKAVLGGFDWGSRTADIIAALWPERCKSLVSVSGYLITNRQAQLSPLAPAAEYPWWYQYYFATDRGEEGLKTYPHDFAKLVWDIVSPTWNFSDATFDRTASSFDNPDWVPIVIHNYRWRLSLAEGERRYDGLEKRLAERPKIAVPTITVDADRDPFTAPGNGDSYRGQFAGRYEHRTLKGIGHNVPQEAPEAFATAVIDAAHL